MKTTKIALCLLALLLAGVAVASTPDVTGCQLLPHGGGWMACHPYNPDGSVSDAYVYCLRDNTGRTICISSNA